MAQERPAQPHAAETTSVVVPAFPIPLLHGAGQQLGPRLAVVPLHAGDVHHRLAQEVVPGGRPVANLGGGVGPAPMWASVRPSSTPKFQPNLRQHSQTNTTHIRCLAFNGKGD